MTDSCEMLESRWTDIDRMLDHAMQMTAESDARINIKGKHYSPVSARVEIFRRCFGVNGRIITQHREVTDDVVRIAVEIQVRVGSDWVTLAEGNAEEYRAASQVNKTSALENAETSAIGRALAALGLHGGEYASANEVHRAVSGEKPAAKPDLGPVMNEGERITEYEGFVAWWKMLRPEVRNQLTTEEGAWLTRQRERLGRPAEAANAA